MPLTSEQLENRRKGLGGSDMAAILGVSPWVTPMQLYLEKRGEIEGSKRSEAMELGELLEPVLRRAYELLKGVSVDVPTYTFTHTKHNFLVANVDGIISKDKLLEIKTSATTENWGTATSQIPIYYNTQVQHYINVLKAQEIDIAVLFADLKLKKMFVEDVYSKEIPIDEVAERIITYYDFRIFTVKRDEDIIALLEDRAVQFWRRIQEGNPPEITNIVDWKLFYRKRLTEEDIECNISILNATVELKNINKQKKELEQREQELKQQIVMFMKDKSTLMYNGYPLGKVIRKSYTTEPQTIDTIYFQLSSNNKIWNNIIKE